MTGAEQTQRDACRDLRAAAGEIAEASARMSDFQKMLSQWRTLVVRGDAQEGLADALAPVDTRVSRGATEMTNLAKLGLRCETLAEHIEHDGLQGALSMVRQEIAKRG